MGVVGCHYKKNVRPEEKLPIFKEGRRAKFYQLKENGKHFDSFKEKANRFSLQIQKLIVIILPHDKQISKTWLVLEEK